MFSVRHTHGQVPPQISTGSVRLLPGAAAYKEKPLACHRAHVAVLSQSSRRSLVTELTSQSCHRAHVAVLSQSSRRSLVTELTSQSCHRAHVAVLSQSSRRSLVTELTSQSCPTQAGPGYLHPSCDAPRTHTVFFSFLFVILLSSLCCCCCCFVLAVSSFSVYPLHPLFLLRFLLFP